LKQLTTRQKDLIKSPKERGKAKEDSSDNYSAIYENASSAFLYLKSIVELLPNFETYRKDFKKANEVCNLFSYENLKPFLTGIFPTREPEGAPMDDRINFDETKITSEKIGSNIDLFKFSSDYLLQAFPENEYKHLHPRINDLIKDLKSMMDTITKNQELKRQLEEYHKHVEYFEPVGLGVHDSVYDIACLYCRSTAIGKTLKEVSEKIEHTPKCLAEKEYDEKNPYKWDRWYKINPPSKLLLSLEQREKFDELLKNMN